MSGTLRLDGIGKAYGRRTIVDGLDLEIEAGRFYTLLGPSGCGKTTTLRMIAGLERPDRGTIRLGERILSSAGDDLFVAPERRDMGMVFQSYAIWPHMTVRENVAFPLRLRRLGARERDARVGEVLELVGLVAHGDAPATELSGGQQQRVAIARALVYRPEVLLLDEPLSNLDARLREQMRLDLRRIQRQLGTTAIMVTHDQAEAMAVSDRIVVMSDGGIEQIGTPEEIYTRPGTAFVMNFLGVVNSVLARAAGPGGRFALPAVGGTELCLPHLAEGAAASAEVTLCFRTEDVMLVMPGDERPDDWRGRVEAATFLGAFVQYAILVGDVRLRVEAPPFPRFAEGDEVRIRPRPDAIRAWPAVPPAPSAAAPARADGPALGGLSSAAD